MNRSAGWDAETVADALAVMDELTLWKLPPDRWQQVDELLAAVTAAFAAGDPAELRDTVEHLAAYGSYRALRIGSSMPDGIPEPVLDRRNTLVHILVQERAAAQERVTPQAPTEGDHADRSPR